MDTRAQILFYLNIAWRRKWLMLVPLVIGLGVSAGMVGRLPKVYLASTTILVTPQQVPSDLVRTTVTTQVTDSISSLTVQVLSRTYLEKVVREFGYVNDTATDQEIEVACRRLARNVDVHYDRREVTWFKILVEDGDPQRAAGVANRLAELFTEQNSQRRTEEATDTLREVERWLAEKKTFLDKKESAVAEFKRLYPWELAESMAANLRLLETRNAQLIGHNTEIRSLEDRLGELRLQVQSQEALDAMTDPDKVTDPALRQLLLLETELADLLVRYTESNPAVKRKRAEIDAHVARHPSLTQVESEEGEDTRVSLGLLGIQSEIVKIENEIEREKESRKRTQTSINELTRRIDNMPKRQAELLALTRDLGSIQADYNELLKKRENARRAEEMEAARRGEQFRVQDVAQTPRVPYKPRTQMILIYGALAGLGLGLSVVAGLELLDQTIRSEAQFQATFPEVKLLISMPHITETVNEGKG